MRNGSRRPAAASGSEGRTGNDRAKSSAPRPAPCPSPLISSPSLMYVRCRQLPASVRFSLSWPKPLPWESAARPPTDARNSRCTAGNPAPCGHAESAARTEGRIGVWSAWMRTLFEEPDRLRKLQPATAQHSTASSLSLHVPKDQTEERLWAHRRVVLVLRNRLVRLDPAAQTTPRLSWTASRGCGGERQAAAAHRVRASDEQASKAMACKSILFKRAGLWSTYVAPPSLSTR